MMRDEIKNAKYTLFLAFWDVDYKDVENPNLYIRKMTDVVDSLNISSDFRTWGATGEYHPDKIDIDMMSVNLHFNDKQAFDRAITAVDSDKRFEMWPQQRDEARSYKFVEELN